MPLPSKSLGHMAIWLGIYGIKDNVKVSPTNLAVTAGPKVYAENRKR